MVPNVPVLEVYYAPTCTPCRLELPVLAESARRGTPLVVVLLTEEGKARRDLAAVSPTLERRAIAARAGRDPREILRAAGDTDGILPFSHVRRADGSICETWRGSLTLERIKALLASCAGR